ncbi:MAG TPA: hypothetical protein ENN67_08390 [Firmicutes bacterium]|nr:hypothetical protein [Bacillota bacterium]
MNTIAVILARTGSTRLHRKAFINIGGMPMVAHAIRRSRGFSFVDSKSGVVAALPLGNSENELAEICVSYSARVFRGSENDVLSRLICAGQSAGADVICRVTADNPLVDKGVVETTWENFVHDDCDYCVMDDTPLGTTAELVKMDALIRAYDLADSDRLKEHPTLAIYENPDRFRMKLVPSPEKWRRPQWRFTIDKEPDLKLVGMIMEKLGLDASLDTIVPFLDSNPEIAEINSDVEQNGWNELKEQKDKIGHVPV